MSRDREPDQGQPLPGEEGGFLSRWSRRKRDIAAQGKATEEAAPAPDDPALAAPAMEAEPALSEAELAEQRRKELDELIAALPRVEEINASTDITGFLDARIPDMLRNAALRATWITDPTIRDFLNDAREYALDYNTPGMAPGYGPLSESEREQAVEFVRTLFSKAPERDASTTLVEDQTTPDGEISDEESRAVPPPSIGAPHNSDAPELSGAPGEVAGEDSGGLQSPDSGRKPVESRLSHGNMIPPPGTQELGEASEAASGLVPVRRRGGGALPI
jgi:hypothetical protein